MVVIASGMSDASNTLNMSFSIFLSFFIVSTLIYRYVTCTGYKFLLKYYKNWAWDILLDQKSFFHKNCCFSYKVLCFCLLVQSASGCRSTTLLFGSLSRLISGARHYRSSNWRCGVNWKRGCCWFIRIIFVKGADQLSKVLEYQCKLPDIFFLRVIFLLY